MPDTDTTEILACLNRIAFSLEEIARKGIPVQQSSPKCHAGEHEWCYDDHEAFEAHWWACGCLCHKDESHTRGQMYAGPSSSPNPIRNGKEGSGH